MSAASSAAGAGPTAGLYGSAEGRKSTPRFKPSLATSRSWISGSGSARPSAGSSSTSARELAGDDLGEERLATLSRAAKLEDVEAVVVGLDERGQRPALPKRGDVA